MGSQVLVSMRHLMRLRSEHESSEQSADCSSFNAPFDALEVGTQPVFQSQSDRAVSMRHLMRLRSERGLWPRAFHPFIGFNAPFDALEVGTVKGFCVIEIEVSMRHLMRLRSEL